MSYLYLYICFVLLYSELDDFDKGFDPFVKTMLELPPDPDHHERDNSFANFANQVRELISSLDKSSPFATATPTGGTLPSS